MTFVRKCKVFFFLIVGGLILKGFQTFQNSAVPGDRIGRAGMHCPPVMVHQAVMCDMSPPLIRLGPESSDRSTIHSGPLPGEADVRPLVPGVREAATIPLSSGSAEQLEQGIEPPPEITASFDGPGEGFEGPQGRAWCRNPSDNSLAVCPDHIVQTVNSRMAIFTKKESRFKTTGEVLNDPIPTNNVFRGFGCAATIDNGDAVVCYNQLAHHWLIVMPVFRRLLPRPNEPRMPKSGEPAGAPNIMMASPAMDAFGSIGIGYSFGGTPHFAGQRFAGRLSHDPPGLPPLRGVIPVEGEAAQTNTMRWMDYSQTAVDYLKKGATTYSTRIAAFRLSKSRKGR